MSGWRAKERNPATGKRKIVFNANEAFLDLPVVLPCGQCIGCRLEKSRQWAIRCVHEASLYEDNCFITLTYDDVHLPRDRSLDLPAFQGFMKRLRRRFGEGIRFFHCGEYGEKFKRPHYHACIFNFDFNDKVLWKVSNGSRLYISESLQELWPFGYSTVGDVTFESAAYVARYVMKKVTGDRAALHYTDFDRATGEVFCERRPEYTTMSRRPGIGKPWLQRFIADVYPSDFVVVNGQKMRPPKYYDLSYEVDNPEEFNKVRLQRKRKVIESAEDATYERLRDRETIQLKKVELLKRGLEHEI